MTVTTPHGVTTDDAPVLAPGFLDLGLLRRGEALDVHDAWSTERDCRCVVKTPRPDRVGDPRVADDLRNEARLLLELAHPHLGRAYELVDAEERPLLVLETLDGWTLDGLVEEEQGLCPDDLAELGRQLVSAVGYLHRRGVLHLDLKPSNVVCTAGVARLIDLSIARPPGPGRAGVGTEGYMAPEQSLGNAVTAATDVYGLAGVLIEAATALPPPPADEAPEWQRRRRPSPHLRDVLTACRAAAPERRPRLDALRAALQGDSA